MKENPYQPPQANLSTNNHVKSKETKKKPSVFLVGFTLFILLVNICLAFVNAFLYGAMQIDSYVVGYVIGRVFFFPVLMVFLFQVVKRFRNLKSQTKIILYSSLLVLLTLLVRIFAMLVRYI